ncbi:hypothetical protein [Stenotrophomonas sp.]|uniref:hypothetical protein n=1 Tax=Stenotrophomonas sp. TaxID=69392 RepID=UPI0028AED344|nr:hypothetical protein [Stenotrophomonas sp.]
MSAQPDRLPMIPELKPLAAHDYVALGVLLLCAPLVVACIWGGCLVGVAQHYRLI